MVFSRRKRAALFAIGFGGCSLSALIACGTFGENTTSSSSSTSSGGVLADGGTSNGDGSGGDLSDHFVADFDAGSCAATIITVDEPFSDGVPPTDWAKGGSSNNGGALATSTTEYYSAAPSLHASGTAAYENGGLSIRAELKREVIPRWVDVRYFVKMATLKDLYSEFGCSISVSKNESNEARFYLAASEEAVDLRVRGATSGEGFEKKLQVVKDLKNEWVEIRHHITFDDDGTTTDVFSAKGSGGISGAIVATVLDPKVLTFYCGIDFADLVEPPQPAVNGNLSVFVDDVLIQICPR